MTRVRFAGWPIAVALAVATLASGALAPAPASAHADLVRSVPAADAELLEPPTEIELWFSEPIEAAFSTVVLLDGTGNRIEPSAIQLSEGNQRAVAELPALDAGVYTVVARTLSQVDGHIAPASYRFVVLGADGSMPEPPDFAATLDGGDGLSALATVGRWVTVVGLVALFGGGALSLVAGRSLRPRDERFVTVVRRSYEQLAVAAVVLVFAGDVATLVALQDALGGSIDALVRETRAGTHLAVREAALLAGLVAAVGWRRGASLRPLIGLAVGAAGLYTVAAVSHATAAPGAAWALASQYVHLLLAAFWLGGLALLAEVARRERPSTATWLALVSWFSRAAMVSVALLAVTGLVRAFGELPDLEALLDSHYGRVLLLKLALLTPLLGVAWLNRRVVESTVGRDATDEAARRLRRLLPAEVALALVVLLSAAGLGQASTPRAASDGASIFSSPAPQLPVALALGMAVAVIVAIGWVALRARPWPALPALSRDARATTAAVAVVGAAVGVAAASLGGVSSGVTCPEPGPGANLAGCDLRGRSLDQVNLRNANLTRADLRDASLRFASLTGATLLGSDLRGADLTGAALHEAVLNDADLRDANLHGANAVGVLLHDADLGGANLFGADLARASLIGASFNGAIVHETHLTEADLTDVDWRNTACPEGPEAIPGGVALCFEGRLPGE